MSVSPSYVILRIANGWLAVPNAITDQGLQFNYAIAMYADNLPKLYDFMKSYMPCKYNSLTGRHETEVRLNIDMIPDTVGASVTDYNKVLQNTDLNEKSITFGGGMPCKDVV